MTAPTSWQVRRTRAVVRWYLETHWGRDGEPGLPGMYTDPAQVGHYAVTLADMRAGDPAALSRVLLATVMFQRLRDVLVLKILRSVPAEAVDEICTPETLLSLAQASGCPHAATTESLASVCDLSKDAHTRAGVCGQEPHRSCAPKRHTVLLRRYGHFGKVPTSIALALREHGARDLGDLLTLATEGRTPGEAAAWIEQALSQSWRVSSKIACMFLSVVSNPDLLPGAAWAERLDWHSFVVIDSNVDAFLEAIGYTGRRSYDARRAFMQELAHRVPLDEYRPGLQQYNPRVVQQAAYMFMSRSNRRASVHDCSRRAPEACGSCVPVTRSLCPVVDLPTRLSGARRDPGGARPLRGGGARSASPLA
jgi:hypothetical protein